MKPAPINWPIGDGDRFMGVYDRHRGKFTSMTARPQPDHLAGTITTIDDPIIEETLSDYQFEELHLNLALMEEMGMDFDQEAFLREKQTPVYFGSALTNFGVQLFLDDLCAIRAAADGLSQRHGPIDPAENGFSGFVFKIQANMNPRHRDSVAFVRICSGRFERGNQRQPRPHRQKPQAEPPLQLFCRGAHRGR
jgi:peptide chain release factor 3